MTAHVTVDFAKAIAVAKRLLEHNSRDILVDFVERAIPRWDRDLGIQEDELTPEITLLLVEAAKNRLALVTGQQLVAAKYLPVIEWPQNLCIPLAIARKIKKQDPKWALWIKKRAANLVLKVDTEGLKHYLDQFCLTGEHLTGRDFCGRI